MYNMYNMYMYTYIRFVTLPLDALVLPSTTANSTLLVNTLGTLALTHTLILPTDSSTGDGSVCMLRTGKSDEREGGSAIDERREGEEERQRQRHRERQTQRKRDKRHTENNKGKRGGGMN